ncbi:ADP-ribosylation factor-binding protein GGA2 [Spathaspora sp. JA1]|nr:ADP-ribosylation factor-binding protein GGA2 [Spathaspora sp. JA1]
MSYSVDKINPKLLRRIYRACRPTNEEPNLGLNLEICDYVNAKKGTAPREAAITIVKLISQRDPQTSELALALLDNLVKNCGYPFQLQISRKEFLNELVKRFPERPPLRYTRVHRLILAQIEEWYQTICRTSKYKDDFGYIKDMHRLLANKGYVFPEVKLEDVAVMNPSDNLKSLEEIQQEEELVHSAKLQELIRRGKPHDLQEANKLMKIMAGFKDDNLKQNKKQLEDDIIRLTRKVEILGEMLTNIENNQGEINDDAIVELYSSIKSSQPIISKIIEEEEQAQDEEKVGELLQLNDTVNNVINKFQLLKNGKLDEASQIKVNAGSAGGSAGGEINLIDFDDDPEDTTVKNDQGYNDLLSDLSNLAFTGNNTSTNTQVNPLNLYGAGGSISLDFPSSNATPLQQPVAKSNIDLLGGNNNLLGGNNNLLGGGTDLLGDFNTPSPQLQSNTSLDPFGLNFPQTTPSQITTPTTTSKVIPITQSANLKIEVDVLNDNDPFKGKLYFSNLQSATISQLKFLIAVPKGCKLNLNHQSSDVIYGFKTHGTTQEFSIENPQLKQLKIKWKVEYVVNGQQQEETGVCVLE